MNRLFPMKYRSGGSVMAILRARDVQQLSDVELQEQMEKLRMEFVQHYGKVSAGGATENPGSYW